MKNFVLRLVGHRCPDSLAAELEMTRRLLRSAGKQRDHAHLLLRAVREVSQLPPALHRSVNCATASESESDIDDNQREVEEFLIREGIR